MWSRLLLIDRCIPSVCQHWSSLSYPASLKSVKHYNVCSESKDIMLVIGCHGNIWPLQGGVMIFHVEDICSKLRAVNWCVVCGVWCNERCV